MYHTHAYLQEQYVYPLTPKDGQPSGYLDIVPTPEGYNHIALFSPADSSVPRWLTYGEWEVAGGIKAVDRKQGLVYVPIRRRGSRKLTTTLLSGTS